MRILLVHQGAELYGSDRSFIECARIFRETYPNATIELWVPKSGPLVKLVTPYVDAIHLRPQIKLMRSDIRYLLLNKLILALLNFTRNQSFFSSYEIVYINTIVILDGIIALRNFSGKKFVHVREVPGRLASYLFSSILRYSRASIIFNSNSSASSFALSHGQSSSVILNGIAGYSHIRERQTENSLVHILVLGRISTGKGQELFLNSVELLSKSSLQRISVRIVGSPAPGCDELKRRIHERCLKLRRSISIELLDFSDKPEEHYAWSDIVVIPSTKPESFGLVAVEAMSAGRLVVAAAHGGLTEIVSNEVNGLLFIPNDAMDLAAKIEFALNNRMICNSIASHGASHFDANFSANSLRQRLGATITQ